MTTYFTGRGDDGTTSLLGARRVSKADVRPQAYGAVDEASAALGFARSLALDEDSQRITIRVQKDLYKLMAELAATPEAAEEFRSIGAEDVTWLERQIERIGERVLLPKEFIVSGDSKAGAAYDLARTVVRRAERRVVELAQEVELTNDQILRYLNRLSTLCFLLLLWENLQAGIDTPRLASDSDV
jgi:cob(I)alamin adenosyltransferase